MTKNQGRVQSGDCHMNKRMREGGQEKLSHDQERSVKQSVT